MKVAIISDYPNGYSTVRLLEELNSEVSQCVVLDDSRIQDTEFDPKGYHAYINRFSPSTVDSRIKSLARIGETRTVYNSLKALEYEADKKTMISLLRRNSIPVPRSHFFTHKKLLITEIEEMTPEIEGVLTTLGDRFVVKTLRGTHGIGVAILDSTESALSVCQLLLSQQVHFILQEYIHDSEEEVRVIVVANRIVAAYAKISKNFRKNFHQKVSTHKTELTNEEKIITLKATKLFGGAFYGVDIIRTKKGPIILELNGSPGLEGVESITGVNIAKVMCDTILKDAENES